MGESGHEVERAKSVEGLRCYQLALQLLEAAYKVVATLPDYEKYNLASQLRRAALSAVLNMAEGYGRYHYLDKLRFFYIARGSLGETRSAFTAAERIGYIATEQLEWAHATEAEAQRSLNGYISFIRRQRQGLEEYGDKAIRDEPIPYDTEPPDKHSRSPDPDSQSQVPDH
jgi:four helix bundle protein